MAISAPTTNHHEIRHWADKNSAVPAEVLPHMLDNEPATLRILKPGMIARPDIRQITWDEFFVKFDELGLTFVYDDDSSGFNEILQIETRNPYRNPIHKAPSDQN